MKILLFMSSRHLSLLVEVATTWATEVAPTWQLVTKRQHNLMKAARTSRLSSKATICNAKRDCAANSGTKVYETLPTCTKMQAWEKEVQSLQPFGVLCWWIDYFYCTFWCTKFSHAGLVEATHVVRQLLWPVDVVLRHSLQTHSSSSPRLCCWGS